MGFSSYYELRPIHAATSAFIMTTFSISTDHFLYTKVNTFVNYGVLKQDKSTG